ncbi:MAG TPA: alginate lyase family protein [Terriglobia bacterium]|nr:alginate lyase family protein [Terriglobia bacterium]
MQAIGYYIRRIAELDLRESLNQAKKTIYECVVAPGQERFKTLFPNQVSPRKILRLTRFSSSAELSSHLKTRSSPKFFIDRDGDFYAAALLNHFPGETEKIVGAADLVMRHIFDLLGSGATDLDSVERRWIKIIGSDGTIQRIDSSVGYLPWHADFKSGVGWDPQTFHKNIKFGQTPGVDVKVPWELSRFQHLIPLGQAYCITGNESYAKEYVRQVTDWINTNPCHYGVNWACTMDVSIRAVNWIWAFYLFRNSAAISDDFVVRLLASLLVHANFIRSNLEYNTAYFDGRQSRLNSNHYLSNIVGLLYIAVMFPELKLKEDLEFAKNEMETELFSQTYADGGDYEHSTFYHRLVAELCLSGFLLLKRNGYVLTPAIEERLQKIGEYVADYLRPDGMAPQIGDADNGRLHPLSVRQIADHRYIPLLVAEEFNRPDLKIKSGDPELLWWIGAIPGEESHVVRSSAAYCDRRFFILRGRSSYVHVSAASVGMRGFGSHSHADILSFEYWAHGQAWLVDPGTYIYTPDPQARNLFRSTESHNTVRIDGEDINPFHPDRLFQISDQSHVIVHEWTSFAGLDRLALEHTGYLRLEAPLRHRRCFQLNKRTGVLTIEDSFNGTGRHLFEWFFHLAPEVTAEQSGSSFLLRTATDTASLEINGANCEFDLRSGWYSPSYGVREPASVIVARCEATPKFGVGITIRPSIGTER